MHIGGSKWGQNILQLINKKLHSLELDMTNWEMLYNSLSKEDRLLVWVMLEKYAESQIKQRNFLSFARKLYAFHRSVFGSMRTTENKFLSRMTIFFVLFNIPMFSLIFEGSANSLTQVAVVSMGNIAGSVMIASIIHIVEKVSAYLKT